MNCFFFHFEASCKSKGYRLLKNFARMLKSLCVKLMFSSDFKVLVMLIILHPYRKHRFLLSSSLKILPAFFLQPSSKAHLYYETRFSCKCNAEVYLETCQTLK